MSQGRATLRNIYHPMHLKESDRPLMGESKGSLQAISRRRGLLDVLLVVGSVSLGGIMADGCASVSRSSDQSPSIAAKASSESRGEWWFMGEAQKESARYIMSLPCDRIEEVLRQSRVVEMPLVFQLIQAAREVQKALASNDFQAIREKSAHFYALAERGEEGAQKKFDELREDPNEALNLMMFQDYFVPAFGHALKLSRLKD
jgi:hypothetical protein